MGFMINFEDHELKKRKFFVKELKKMNKNKINRDKICISFLKTVL